MNTTRQHVTILFYFFIGTIVLGSCSGPDTKTDKEWVSEPEKMDLVVTKTIKGLLQDAADLDGKVDDSITLTAINRVSKFYNLNDYGNIWSSGEQWHRIADSMIHFIQYVHQYGLFPESYHYKQICAIAERFNSDTLSKGDRIDALLWSKVDLMLTDAFFSIAKHVHRGRLNPDSIYKHQDAFSDSMYIDALQKVRNGASLSSVFRTLEPRHRGYHALKEAMRTFLDTAHLKLEYTHLVYPYKDSVLFIQQLTKRLKEEGLVKWQQQQIDTVQLTTVLRLYQQKKGLKQDGRVGPRVVELLNQTDPEKFRRIAINLDRYRMMSESMPDRYIWVNLPGYYLQIWDRDTLRLESKVIVGKPQTRTPLLTSRISDLVTYPQWTIPNSIIVKEILPALKKNPGYLARKGYSLMKYSGEIVDPYSVNWSRYSKGIPYRVVQGSGDDNALGVLKFNFPNPYSVYMHDTNQRYLFRNENRSMSHGCVRVQEWEKMAYYISALDSSGFASDTTRIPSDSIRIWLQRKEKHIIPVKSELPVYFRYFTTDVRNGKLQFYVDIYGEDKRILESGIIF
ncbi:MAG: L,D-transpeptidase family protein [Lacibacter sp.]